MSHHRNFHSYFYMYRYIQSSGLDKKIYKCICTYLHKFPCKCLYTCKCLYKCLCKCYCMSVGNHFCKMKGM